MSVDAPNMRRPAAQHEITLQFLGIEHAGASAGIAESIYVGFPASVVAEIVPLEIAVIPHVTAGASFACDPRLLGDALWRS